MKRHAVADYANVLVMAAIAVTVSRYCGAFIASDLASIPGWLSVGLTVLTGISGVGMGVLDALGLAYMVDAWRRALPKAGQRASNRFKVLSGFALATTISGVVIVTGYTVARITGVSIGSLLTGVMPWAWAGLVNLAPYLVIGGVMVASTEPVQRSEQPAAVSARTGRSSVRSWTELPAEDRTLVRSMTSAEIVRAYGVDERTARRWRSK